MGLLRPGKLMVVGKLGIFADLAGRACGVGEDGTNQSKLFREFQKDQYWKPKGIPGGRLRPWMS